MRMEDVLREPAFGITVMVFTANSETISCGTVPMNWYKLHERNEDVEKQWFLSRQFSWWRVSDADISKHLK